MFVFSFFFYSKRIWRALFQNAISANTKTEFAMPMLSSYIMFWKRALRLYVDGEFLNMYLKGLFAKQDLQTVHWDYKLISLDRCLSRFGKELFIYYCKMPFLLLLGWCCLGGFHLKLYDSMKHQIFKTKVTI